MTQTAYQVQVASGDSFSDLVWDSGATVSGDQVDVAYGGPSLASATRYFWRVKVRDAGNVWSSWSQPGWFETGLLDDSEWSQAAWIGKSSAGATWEDYTVTVEFKMPDDQRSLGLLFRMSDDKSKGYMWQLGWVASGGQQRPQLRPHTRDNSKWARLATTPWLDSFDPRFTREYMLAGGPESDGWHTATLTVAGNTASIALDGVALGGPTALTVADTGTGRVGLRMQNQEQLQVRRLQVVGSDETVLGNPSFSSNPFSSGSVDGGILTYPSGTGAATAEFIDLLPAEGRAGLPILRSEFEVDPGREVVSARLYASAKGLYELSLNGAKVGDQFYAPGFTNYVQRFQTQTYDVTDLLRPGANAIGGMLGDGWFNGYLNAWGKNRFGVDYLALIGQLHIVYASGADQWVRTDSSWTWDAGPLTKADLQLGESWDANAEQQGWDEPGFAATGWATVNEYPNNGFGALVPQPDEPVRDVDIREVATVTHPVSDSPTTTVYDLGQNLVGVARVTLTGTAGEVAKLRHAEEVYTSYYPSQQGQLYVDNLRGQASGGPDSMAVDTYTFPASCDTPCTVTWTPRFTQHGFRYLEISGLATPPGADQVKGIVRSSDLPGSGRLTTSNALVNQILSNSYWGGRGNFVSIPTDTPARDERMGWLGDINVYAATGSYWFDTRAFLAKWMSDLTSEQCGYGIPARDDCPAGAFQSIAPRPSGTHPNAVGWEDAAIGIPWALFMAYGHLDVVKDNWTAMTRFMEYLTARVAANGNLDPARGAARYSMDGLNLEADGTGSDSKPPKDLLSTVYTAEAFKRMAIMAEAIGEDAQAEAYAERHQAMRQAFTAAYVAADGTVTGDSQGSYALALGADMITSADLATKAGGKFASRLAEKGNHLTTGFLTLPYLLPALTRAGRLDLAYTLLLNEDYPSWGYSVSMGATTMWERWNSILPTGQFNPDGMNSFNHYAYGAVADWVHQTVGGISPTTAGYRSSVIAPRPGGGITSASDSTATPYGVLSSGWKQRGTVLELDVTVPVNTTAEVHLPAVAVADVTESGAPLSQDTAGVKALAVDGDAGEVVVTVGSGDYSFRAAAPAVSVSLPRLEASATPGEKVTGVLVVENQGDSAVDSVVAAVTISGLTDPITITGGPVEAGRAAELGFAFRVPSGTRAGETWNADASVLATSGDEQRTFTTTTPGFLAIASPIAIDTVAIGPRVGSYPQTGEWTVTATVTNSGAAPVVGQLTARTVAGVLQAGAPSEVVTIPAGDSVQVPVTVFGGGQYGMPIMQAVTVDFVDRGDVLASRTSAERIKWYGPHGQGWNTTGQGAVPGATDWVDFGDGGTGTKGNTAANVKPGPTELAHNLQWDLDPATSVGGTNTEGGLTRRFMWSRTGRWFSVDLSIDTGKPFVLTLRETADTSSAANIASMATRYKGYQILVDEVQVRHMRYLIPNEGVVGNTLMNYQVLVDDPAALDADQDGKVTVKFRYPGPDGGDYDGSLTDIWVTAPVTVADEGGPTVSAAPADTTVYGENGWITQPTSVVVTTVDAVDPDPTVAVALDDEPPAAYTDPVPMTTDGTHVLRYWATDAAGNRSAEQSLAVKIDTTKPVPAFGEWPSGTIRQYEVPLEPACQGSDATSGIASCDQTGYSTELGQHTITQRVVDNAGNTASATLTYEVVAVDGSALLQVVSAAKTLDEDDYTASSWSGLASALAGAEEVLGEGEAPQTRVDEATTALTEAISELVRRGDPAVLEALIAAADALSGKLAGFTDESVAALTEAVASARQVYQDRADRTQAQLDTAASAVQAAMSGLVMAAPTVDTSVLQAVYSQAEILSNDNDTYTPSSWSALQAGLAAAEAVLADRSATQAEVDAAMTKLGVALAGLEVAPDKAALRQLYNSAKTLSNADGKYTAKSWSALQSRLVVAKRVLDNKSATQAQISQATEELGSALAGLAPAAPTVSKVKLNQSQLRLVKGKSLTLEEGVYFTDGTAAYAGAASWTSSDTKVATVTRDGKVKAKKPGAVTITVTSTKANAAGRKVSAKIKVTVVKSKPKAKVSTVSASVPRSMKVGSTAYLTGKYSSVKATGVKVTYFSSKTKIATVDKVGRIQARAKGTVKITVKAGGKSKTYTVKVT
ncbi:MAG: family 78 glycoside hydrolase catalytic domain [Propionicimonas sp.]|nr:family 78 glycoside hydrolase catalytic domain [Propionicimonas sp.]